MRPLSLGSGSTACIGYGWQRTCEGPFRSNSGKRKLRCLGPSGGTCANKPRRAIACLAQDLESIEVATIS